MASTYGLQRPTSNSIPALARRPVAPAAPRRGGERARSAGLFATEARTPRPVCVVELAADVVAIFCDVAVDAPDAAELLAADPRLRLVTEGGERGRRVASTTLVTAGGGRRFVIVVGGASVDDMLASAFAVQVDRTVLARWSPWHLQSPVRRLDELVDGLAAVGASRLVRLLATTATSLFRTHRCGAYSRSVRQLIAAMRLTRVDARRLVRLRGVGLLVTAEVPDDVAIQPPETLAWLHADGVRDFRQPVARLGRRGGRRSLQLLLPDAESFTGGCVGLGEASWYLAACDAVVAEPLAGWLGEQSPAVRLWLDGVLANEAQWRPAAAALRRELGADDARPPRLMVDALARTDTGVVAAATLDDPLDLVRTIHARVGGHTFEWPMERRDDEPAAANAAPTRHFIHWTAADAVAVGTNGAFELELHSGRRLEAGSPTVGRLDRAVPAPFVDDGALGADALAVLADVHAGRSPRYDPRRCHDVGAPSTLPRLALIVPVAEVPDVLRTRAAMLRSERGLATTELVYVVPDGPTVAGVHALLGDLERIYGVPARLVVTDPDGGRSDDLVAGIRAARAPAVLLLGADVLPTRSGWLAEWTRTLAKQRRTALLGGVVVASDGRIVHAGDGPAGRRRRVPDPSRASGGVARTARRAATTSLSPACVGLAPVAVAAVRGLTRPYLDPDILLASLSSDLKQAGFSSMTWFEQRFETFQLPGGGATGGEPATAPVRRALADAVDGDRKSTRLNSSHYS